MLEIIASRVNQGRSFVLIDKAVSSEGNTLFITLELSDKMIIDRARVLNKVKYNYDKIGLTVKQFPSMVDIDVINDFIKKEGHKYDNILIDQSYFVQTKVLGEGVSLKDTHKFITEVYHVLSLYMNKNIVITYSLGIKDCQNTDLVKKLDKVDEFIKGNIKITNTFNKNDFIYKNEYPYDNPKSVIDLALFREEWKKQEVKKYLR
jgi:hypothetical protein